MVFPATGYAQVGLIGAIQGVLSVINGTIHEALNAVEVILGDLDRLHREVVWPIPLVERALAAIDALVAEFRELMWAVDSVSVASTTLPAPANLEAVIRNPGTDDFGALAQSYRSTYGALPPATDADELARDLIDVDDAMALNTIKTLKASDEIGGLIIQSGDRIEDAARTAAPGSAPFLTAAGLAANIQSQAMMQKMLAAMIRQEAARIAHENALRKRHGVLLTRVRKDLSDLLERQR
jgi:hypothetical protein